MIITINKEDFHFMDKPTMGVFYAILPLLEKLKGHEENAELSMQLMEVLLMSLTTKPFDIKKMDCDVYFELIAHPFFKEAIEKMAQKR